MEVRTEIVHGLREEFLRGATYSGLLRYLLAHHDEGSKRALVQSYLYAAFHVLYFHPARSAVHRRENDDCYASIDWWLIPEIISTSDQWMEPGAVGWWEKTPQGLKLAEKSKPTWLSDQGWANLTEKDREEIVIVCNSCETYCRTIAIMARLAEQMQRRYSEEVETNRGE